VDTETGECEITGLFEVVKRWRTLPSNPEGYPVVWLRPQFSDIGTVTISPDSCVIWFWGQVQGPTRVTIPHI